MDVSDEMQKLGFSKNEAATYLALLGMGQANLHSLEKKTLIHRANLLGALERLEKKGAIGVGLAGKRKEYFATEPKALLGRMRTENEETITLLGKKLAEQKRGGAHSPLSVFYGKEGVKNILDDELGVGQTINVVQSSKNVEERSGSYLAISREKRWRQGQKMRIIYEKSDLGHAKKAAAIPLTEVKVAESGLGPVTIDVYGNRAVLIFGEEPTIVRIVNQDVATAFLSLFEIMGKNAKPLQK